jgi:hypothetical protein
VAHPMIQAFHWGAQPLLASEPYLDITTTRQVVQVRHRVYDAATLQPPLGSRISVFDLYKLFIFNMMHNVAHELLYIYAHFEATLHSYERWGYTYEGGPIMAEWNPWHTLETLRRELDRVFDEAGPRNEPFFVRRFSLVEQPGDIH